MTIEGSIVSEGVGRAEQSRVSEPRSELVREDVAIDVERSGDWMPAEDLRVAAQAALARDADVTVNLYKLDHLDASALQILLALDTEQKKRGQNLHLVNASPHLRQWFGFAGVADRFSIAERKSNE